VHFALVFSVNVDKVDLEHIDHWMKVRYKILASRIGYTTQTTNVHAILSYATHHSIHMELSSILLKTKGPNNSFNSLFSRTTWVSRYQKGKNQSGFK